jgi:uncharacterized iron-regulated membrane protein
MLRTVLFWFHLTAGVLAGAIVLLMSATGVLLTYEKQAIHWADLRQLRPVTAPVTPQLPVDSLVTIAARVSAGKTATAVTLRANASEPVQVSFGREGVLFLDPTTGALLGEGSTTTRAFFRSVENWHRWLAGTGPNRDRLRSVTGAANLLFLVLVITGLVLWLPATWTWIRVRAVLWFRAGLTGKARDFNWHNVLGVWSALPLIAIVASGVVISYPWAGDLVYRVVGEEPPPRQAPVSTAATAPRGNNSRERSSASLSMGGDTTTHVVTTVTVSAMIASAAPLMPQWKSVTVQLPKPGAETATVTLDRGTGGQPHLRAAVTFATATGAITKYQPFDSLSTGRRARNVLRFTHTGEVLGIGGQTLAGLVSLASVVLVITGLSLSVRRASRALQRRTSRRSESSVSVPTA